MSSKSALFLFSIVVVSICTFFFGMHVAEVNESYDSFSVMKDNRFNHKKFNEFIDSIPEGTSVEIDLETFEQEPSEYHEGAKVNIKSNRDYVRFFSWFGLGGPEAAAMDQGLTVSEGGLETEAGKQEGYGVLEKFWNWIKSVFWFGIFGVVILLLMLFIPGLAPIAGGILRFLGSIIPFIGSIIERLVARFRFEKPLKQTITGGQEFKQRINKSEKFSEEQKKLIKEIFTDSMKTTQDEEVQHRIKKTKVQ
jgi:hypothetical protein